MITIGLVMLPNTEERYPATGPRRVSLFFLFWSVTLFEMVLVNDDDQGLGLFIKFRDELLGLSQEVNPADL